MANIIATYGVREINELLEAASWPGDVLDTITAYLHEERDCNDQVTGYWWLDETHHSYATTGPASKIYKTVQEAEAGLVAEHNYNKCEADV